MDGGARFLGAELVAALPPRFLRPSTLGGASEFASRACSVWGTGVAFESEDLEIGEGMGAASRVIVGVDWPEGRKRARRVDGRGRVTTMLLGDIIDGVDKVRVLMAVDEVSPVLVVIRQTRPFLLRGTVNCRRVNHGPQLLGSVGVGWPSISVVVVVVVVVNRRDGGGDVEGATVMVARDECRIVGSKRETPGGGHLIFNRHRVGCQRERSLQAWSQPPHFSLNSPT